MEAVLQIHLSPKLPYHLTFKKEGSGTIFSSFGKVCTSMLPFMRIAPIQLRIQSRANTLGEYLGYILRGPAPVIRHFLVVKVRSAAKIELKYFRGKRKWVLALQGHKEFLFSVLSSQASASYFSRPPTPLVLPLPWK